MEGDAFYKRMRDLALFTGIRLSPSHNPGVASPYTGRKKMYFSQESNDFAWNNAKYASNYYAAQVQGVIPGTGKFEDIRGAYIRSSDVVEQTTGAQLPNDWQIVYFQDPRIQGLYTGAKLWYGGNTWLCTAPRSVASDTGNAVIRRCNAIWNHLDFYGNVVTESFVWSKGPANATSNEYLDYNSIAHDYQKCCIQRNANTAELRHNTRIMLGHTVYQAAGIVDFICDFGEITQKDGESAPRQTSETCHIIYFDLYRTETIGPLDDTEREIADGLAFGWKIKASIDGTMQAGATQNLGVYSLRSDADAQDVPVYSTDEHPITYLYESSDESVLAVDDHGNVTAMAEGSASVRVTLAQNPEIHENIFITVTESEAGPALTITPELPDSMNMMGTASAVITYTENGAPVSADIEMTARGPAPYCYTASLEENKLNVTCWEGSPEPLELTFACNGITIKRTIQLRGLA